VTGLVKSQAGVKMSCHYIPRRDNSSVHNPLLRTTKDDYYEQEAFRATLKHVRSILICARKPWGAENVSVETHSPLFSSAIHEQIKNRAQPHRASTC